jgi:hypothetical protein
MPTNEQEKAEMLVPKEDDAYRSIGESQPLRAVAYIT